MPDHPLDRYAGITDVAALKEACARPPRKSVRVNTLKSSAEAFCTYAQTQGWELSPVPWCPEGFFVERDDRRRALGKDALHLLGHTYMQEASSMLPPVLLEPEPGEAVLDMAAAPGSKTTQMAAQMKNRGVLVANDVQEKRLRTLGSALKRYGVINTLTVRKVGHWYAKHMTERFDRVLVDAPCTGLGTVRRDSAPLEASQPQGIAKLSRLQWELLEAGIHAARVGGRIVYSTCTFSPEENEKVVSSILNKFSDQLEVVDPREHACAGSWDIQTAIDASFRVQDQLATTHGPWPFVRLWPHESDTDGFFCAVLRKTGRTREPEEHESVPFAQQNVSRNEQNRITKYLRGRHGTPFLREKERLFQTSKQYFLTNADVASFALPVRNRDLGLPFGKPLTHLPVLLSHALATLRGGDATENVCPVDDSGLADLFSGRDIPCDPALHGQVLFQCNGMCAGHGKAKEGTAKNNLPRWMIEMRT